MTGTKPPLGTTDSPIELCCAVRADPKLFDPPTIKLADELPAIDAEELRSVEERDPIRLGAGTANAVEAPNTTIVAPIATTRTVK